ncbi:MAG TPA: GNAT family N-acetyltransferase, partial [Planctomycetota bacterium]|nr:GNAT family N-acetyltransferase [Planctomycetota bacterium]
MKKKLFIYFLYLLPVLLYGIVSIYLYQNMETKRSQIFYYRAYVQFTIYVIWVSIIWHACSKIKKTIFFGLFALIVHFCILFYISQDIVEKFRPHWHWYISFSILYFLHLVFLVAILQTLKWNFYIILSLYFFISVAQVFILQYTNTFFCNLFLYFNPITNITQTIPYYDHLRGHFCYSTHWLTPFFPPFTFPKSSTVIMLYLILCIFFLLILLCIKKIFMKNILYTKRLKIRPRNKKEMKQLIEKTEDEELQSIYKDMLQNMFHGAIQWNSNWKISLLSTGQEIGCIAFMGPPDYNQRVEIGYIIDEPFQHQGYATEAVQALVSWALLQKNVQSIIAYTKEQNIYSQKVLLKNNFQKECCDVIG